MPAGSIRIPKRLPKDLANEALSAMMRDPRYFDGDATGHEEYVDFVRTGFETVHGDGVVADNSREEALAEGIRRMDPKERTLLLLQILRGEIARRYGLGPDGPVRRRKAPGSIQEKPEDERHPPIDTPSRQVLDDASRNQRAMRKAEEQKQRLEDARKKGERDSKNKPDRGKPASSGRGRLIGDPWMLKKGNPWGRKYLWE